MKRLDMRGQACPIPVVKAKHALANETLTQLEILVDDAAAVQNLGKMAEGLGYVWKEEAYSEGDFLVCIRREWPGSTTGHDWSTEGETVAKLVAGSKNSMALSLPFDAAQSGATILISRDVLGEGEPALGSLLMRGFIFALSELEMPPASLIFLNKGIELVCEGSTSLEDIARLSGKGTSILVCGTCLNYYARLDNLRIGEVVDMLKIALQLNSAACALTL